MFWDVLSFYATFDMLPNTYQNTFVGRVTSQAYWSTNQVLRLIKLKTFIGVHKTLIKSLLWIRNLTGSRPSPHNSLTTTLDHVCIPLCSGNRNRYVLQMALLECEWAFGIWDWQIVTLSQLNHIPTIGPSTPILSYLGAYRFVYEAKEMLNEGYMKVHSSPILPYRLELIVVALSTKVVYSRSLEPTAG